MSTSRAHTQTSPCQVIKLMIKDIAHLSYHRKLRFPCKLAVRSHYIYLLDKIERYHSLPKRLKPRDTPRHPHGVLNRDSQKMVRFRLHTLVAITRRDTAAPSVSTTVLMCSAWGFFCFTILSCSLRPTRKKSGSLSISYSRKRGSQRGAKH